MQKRATIVNKLFSNTQTHVEQYGNKISIIGAGMVGIASALFILGSKITNNLVIIDPFGEKVKGEVLDLQHGASFLQHPRITGGNDFSATKGSKLCVITSGVKQEEHESRLSLAQRNTDIMVKLIPELVKHSPDTIILMLGNPCDVLTYVAWRISGLPQDRVIGAGTSLDTQRFRVLIAQKFRVSPSNVHAWIVGEHGENSIPLWSSVNISGVRIKEINPMIGTDDDPDNFIEIHKEVIRSAADILNLKGYISWGVGRTVAALAETIIRNNRTVFPVSVNANGKFGIEGNVFIPLPAVLGINGICDIVNLELSEDELISLKTNADYLKSIQDQIVIKGIDVKCRCRRCRS